MISKSSILDNLKTLFYALIIALIIRSFFLQPFYIPSSSMEPNLLVGDRLFVTKYSYGYSKHSFPFSPNIFNGRIMDSMPKMGDVVVFKTPADNRTDYIKRLIGLPGDRIEVQNGNLIINSKSLEYENIREDSKVLKNGRVIKINVLKETLPNGISYEIYNYLDGSPGDNTKEFVVPENHYFFMGDNRDNSNDSRFWGTVEFNRLVGKAQIIFFSTEDGSTILEFWKWPFDIQFNRLLKLIN